MALDVPYRSIPDMFLKRVAATPDRHAFAHPAPDDSGTGLADAGSRSGSAPRRSPPGCTGSASAWRIRWRSWPTPGWTG